MEKYIPGISGGNWETDDYSDRKWYTSDRRGS